MLYLQVKRYPRSGQFWLWPALQNNLPKSSQSLNFNTERFSISWWTKNSHYNIHDIMQKKENSAQV